VAIVTDAVKILTITVTGLITVLASKTIKTFSDS